MVKTKKISKFIYWSPRLLGIIFILFITLFSLDIFDMKLGFWGTVLGLLMHNIRSIILAAILIISWKYEWVGGVVFIIAGLLYIFSTLRRGIAWHLVIIWSMIIAGPAFLIGILFLINWKKKKKMK